MKATTTTAELKRALATIKPAIGRRSSLPALKCCRLEALESGELELSATDTEKTIIRTIGAEVARPGAILLELARLEKAAKSWRSDELELEALPGKAPAPALVRAAEHSEAILENLERKHSERSSSEHSLKLDAARRQAEQARAAATPAPGSLRLAGGGRELELKAGAGLEDWPKINRAADQIAYVMRPAELARALKRLGGVASSDEVRPILTQIRIDGGSSGDDPARMVATDSYRLAWSELEILELEAAAGGDWSTTRGLALKAAAELKRSGGGAVVLSRSKCERWSAITWRAAGGKVSMIARVPEGEYPKYRQLIPEGLEELEADSSEIAGAIGEAAPVLERNTPLRLRIGGAGEGLEIAAECHDVGTYAAPIGSAKLAGALEETEIGVNPSFFAAGLEYLELERVRIGTKGALRPMLLTAPGAGDGLEAREGYLVMPIRLNV